MNIKRLPPTHLDDAKDLPAPRVTYKSPVPKRTWVNKVVYYAVEYADDADKAGDIIVAYSKKNLGGRLKWIGQALGYCVKFLGGYVDKNIKRADDLRK